MALAVMATIHGRSVAGTCSNDVFGGLDPIHLGHLDVHQHEVVALALDRLDRLDAIACDVRLVAHQREQAESELLIDDVVLDEQDPEWMPRGVIGVKVATPRRRPR